MFISQENGILRCPVGTDLWLNEVRVKMPYLVRKCKRDTLPLLSVPRTRDFFHLPPSLCSPRGSKGNIPFPIEVPQKTVFRCDTLINTL